MFKNKHKYKPSNIDIEDPLLEEENIIKKIKNNPFSYRYLKSIFKENRNVILAALNEFGLLIEFVPENIYWNKERTIYDKEIIHTALKDTGASYQKLPSELKSNKYLALCALRRSSKPFYNMSTSLRTNLKIILRALKHNLDIIKEIPTKLNNCAKIIFTFLNHEDTSYSHIKINNNLYEIYLYSSDSNESLKTMFCNKKNFDQLQNRYYDYKLFNAINNNSYDDNSNTLNEDFSSDYWTEIIFGTNIENNKNI
jgi:hypothetical protein